jgi:hypothetical protein
MAKKDFSFNRKEPVEKQVKDRDIDEFIKGEKDTLVRKTIVIPEKYFTMVKIEAAKRHLKAYQVWEEIVESYFKNKQL